MANLIPPKAPNLLIAPPAEYEARYQEQLNGALRLYFNTIDNGLGFVYGPLGGSNINFPHISARSEVDQTASAANTPTIIEFDTLISNAGFTLNPSGTATAAVSGVYTIQYSVQIANTANQPHDFFMWLRVNNVNVVETARSFTLIARKSAGNPSFLAGYSSISFEVFAGDEIALYWATDQAYVAGVSDGIYLEAQPAITSPYARPSIPSASGSITFVSSLST
jgi:hypothetical protein